MAFRAPDCDACGLLNRCLALQIDNQRRRAFVHPFARPECDTQFACEPPANQHTGITKQVLAALAQAGRPLTRAEIIAAVGVRGELGHQALSETLSNLRRSGRLAVVGQTRSERGVQVAQYILADREAA